MDEKTRALIRARLAKIEAAGGGVLTPDAVVADAKNPKSPLHGCFEWDVNKAAAKFWVDQARALITSIHVVQRTDKTAVNVVFYVRDPSADDRAQGYRSVDNLRSNSDLARAAIIGEFQRAGDVLRRAKQLAIALGAEDDVDALIDKVTEIRERFRAGERPAPMQ